MGSFVWLVEEDTRIWKGTPYTYLGDSNVLLPELSSKVLIYSFL